MQLGELPQGHAETGIGEGNQIQGRGAKGQIQAPHPLGSHSTLTHNSLEINETLYPHSGLSSPAAWRHSATSHPPLPVERKNHMVS